MLLSQPDDSQQLCVSAFWILSVTLEAADCVQKYGSCGPGVSQVPAVQDITGIRQTQTVHAACSCVRQINGGLPCESGDRSVVQQGS